MKNLFLFAVLLCLYVSCNTSSGKGKPEDDSLQYYPPTPGKLDKEDFRSYYRQLSSFFDTGLLKSGFNGGILIAKDGNIIYEKYQGKVDLRKNDSITSNTSFHIASTSKTFTAIAILRLIQENQLSLNDTIAKFFPGFPYADITVKLLLSHRSGLPNYLYFMSNSNWDKKKYVTNEDVLQFLINEKPNKSYSPDKRFNYCNTNFVLLALIVERITGKSFPEYMQQKIFNPLQMANSFVFTYKDTEVNKGLCSAADILQFAVEKKLALRPYDKDMIVMLHEIEYELEGKKIVINSSLVVKGENNLRTAMAKTVGLPLGIAAKNILNGKIKLTGLHIPTVKEIYEPVLAELETYNVKFDERKREL